MIRSPAVEMHRRAFLLSCGALTLALSGCSSVLHRTRLGRLILTDPHLTEYGPVLRALIETILPFDHPRFPRIQAGEIEGRLLELFPLEEGEQYLVVQKGLMIFNQTDLFPVLQSPMVADERALLHPDRSPGHGAAAAIAEWARQDQRLYAEFARTLLPGGASPFTALAAAQRAGYLQLWGSSGFNSKRRFAGAAKRLVMATAWSHHDFWHVIGYAGPLLTDKP